MVQVLGENEFGAQVVAHSTDVANSALGAKVVALSDEWFAAADNLLNPNAPIRDKTRFTHAGAWYDGWETRRHNASGVDWVVIQLGAAAQLTGAEVDTAFFDGNHAPHIAVQGAMSADGPWEDVIDKVECGPSARHFFAREAGATEKAYTFARLQMFPDGGIARFRLYGLIEAPKEGDGKDYASALNGGVIAAKSDEHFGKASNLLLPGRGHDMSDGWETKRSRVEGHIDWAVVKLGRPIVPRKIVVDTAHFRGNFPQYVAVDGSNDSTHWEPLVERAKTQADHEHVYTLDNKQTYAFVRLTLIPDGGVKRFRVYN